MHWFRKNRYFGVCVLGLLMALLSCSAPAPSEPKAKLPEFGEGGTLELQAQGRAVTVRFDSFRLANTDAEAPDLIEIDGPGTSVVAAFNDKLKDGQDGMSDYTPLVSKPIPIQPQAGEEEQTVNLPGLGIYPVLGGNITLQKFQHGMDGRDWWEGSIELRVRTAAGPSTLVGAFKGGIVPTW